MKDIQLEFEKKRGMKFHAGFHVPPFVSVDHVHLHLIVLPCKNMWRLLKYPTWNVTWFVSLTSLLSNPDE